MVHLDTSVLVDALTGQRRSLSTLREVLESPEPVTLCSIVLFEWLRGPRLKEEIDIQEALFPGANAIPFGFVEAQIASTLYKTVKRPRGREADLAIAASALSDGASLWTLNTEDFRDIPALTLWHPGV
jgi:predicted nucleic acid-binding protein